MSVQRVHHIESVYCLKKGLLFDLSDNKYSNEPVTTIQITNFYRKATNIGYKEINLYWRRQLWHTPLAVAAAAYLSKRHDNEIFELHPADARCRKEETTW